MTELDSTSSVAQWVSSHPQTARVFEELRIDYCCGGAIGLAEACQQKGLDPDEITTRLVDYIKDAPQISQQNWLEEELASLCDHIQTTHHEYLRSELPRLSAMINKVVNAHGDRHPELAELQQVFIGLRAELEPHMQKEEQILFPAIRQMELAANRPEFPFGTVANPIRMMEHEHDVAGGALARLRSLTTDFQPPEGACNTYRVMLESLEQLERDMHQHVHKENNILFPRAQAMEARLPSGV